MGFATGVGVAAVSLITLLVGRAHGIDSAILIAAQVLFWIGGLIPVSRGGHRAFKTGANTDVVAYALVLGVYVSASARWWGQP